MRWGRTAAADERPIDWEEYVVANPKVMVGKPVVTGTPVGAVAFASRDLAAEEQAARIPAVVVEGGMLEGMHTVISRRTICQRPL